MKIIATTLFIFVFITFATQAETKAIVGATLINPANEAIVENSVVIIENGVISDAGPRASVKIPSGAETIDANGKFLIPGLIDSHIHFFQSGGLYTRPDGLDLRHRISYEEELAAIDAELEDTFKRYLRCGVTGVADLGGPFWNFSVRDFANETEAAPNVWITGPLLAAYSPDQLQTDDPGIIKVWTVDEALELVDEQLEYNPDYIKIWYVVNRRPSLGLEKFFPIAKAICERSHAAGKPVVIHATELETAKKAVEAGCDVLAHSVIDEEVDDEFIDMLLENDVTLIPTIWVFSSYASVYSMKLDLTYEEHLLGNPYVVGTLFDMRELAPGELGERQLKLLREDKPIEINEIAKMNLKKLHTAGVKIAAGTDAGNVGVIPGPSMFREMQIMVDAGLTELEVLKTATINAAGAFGAADELGSIEKGKLADIVILNSNPLDDISNAADIAAVVKSGVVFKPEDLVDYSAEDLAQIQLNAYNERDLEAFLAVYSDDVEVYNFPTMELRYKGKDKMRETYGPYFEKATELHCELVDRIVQGSYVFDREYVTTGIEGRNPIHATAIYETEDGLIRKVFFLPILEEEPAE